MNAPYDPDTFSKDRVDAAATILGIDLSHTEQWDYIQSLAPLDVQAAPGSGKTSLIGLKLALLAQTWTSSSRGVCVLSHTNTAKDEITSRLMASPAGSKLLHYPHFIGTIQSFTNTFFALPAIRSLGIEVQAIDDTAYAEAAVRLFRSSPDFRTLRLTLGRTFDKGESLIGGAHFVWEGGDLTVASSGKLPFGPTTESGAQFDKLKRHLARQGVFRYVDMYAIAERSLAQNAGLAGAAAYRFPFVLLDEMQDTDDTQQKLLDQVFAGTDAIVQRVGDVNQGIFTEKIGRANVRPSSFPLPDALELCVSRRFGRDIAEFASALTIHRTQTIEGAGPQGKIAVLLYDDDCVLAAVPAFEQLAARYVPHALLMDNPPRVLGARKEPGTSDKYPQSISCYVPGYVAAKSITGKGALIGIARSARARRSNGEEHGAVELLWNTIRGAIRSTSPLPTLRGLTRPALSPGGLLRALLLDIASAKLDDEQRWEKTINDLLQLLVKLTGDQSIEPNMETLAYVPQTYDSPQQYVPPAVRDDGAVSAVVGTIQGAKGETHSATLIVECLDGSSGKQYDVHEVLSRFVGGEGFAASSKTLQRMAELVFVGASRPTHLLAFAVHRARAEPYIEALFRRGWLVRDLTRNPNPPAR